MEKKHKKEDAAALKKKVAEQQKIIAEYTNQLKRLQAEFENYMKRVEKEREEVQRFARAEVVLKVLSTMDSCDHALKHMKDANNEYVKGFKMIAQQIQKLLDEENVHPIKATGERFDPLKHEVMMKVTKKDLPDGTIVEELQKGYTMGDHVIRFSRVSINKREQEVKHGKDSRN